MSDFTRLHLYDEQHFNQSSQEPFGYQNPQEDNKFCFRSFHYEQFLYQKHESIRAILSNVRLIDGYDCDDRLLDTKLSLNQVQVPKKKALRKKGRQVRQILYPQSVALKRAERLKGMGNETQNIGKHLKSLTISFLKVLIDARICDSHEASAILNFKESNGGISDFEELFQKSRIRDKCLQYYSSKDFAKAILKSSKMCHHNKIIMLKYLERLRSIGYVKLAGWKFSNS